MIKFTSFIRRINRRLSGLAKKFGKESVIYQNEVSKIDSVLPNSNIRYNKEGIIQIAKPKLLEDLGYSQTNLLDNMYVPTSKEVLLDYQKQYESFKQDTNIDISIADFINSMENAKDLFSRYFNSDDIKDVMSSVKIGRRKLDKDILQKGKESLQVFMNQRESKVKPTYEDFINLSKVVDKYGI